MRTVARFLLGRKKTERVEINESIVAYIRYEFHVCVTSMAMVSWFWSGENECWRSTVASFQYIRSLYFKSTTLFPYLLLTHDILIICGYSSPMNGDIIRFFCPKQINICFHRRPCRNHSFSVFTIYKQPLHEIRRSPVSIPLRYVWMGTSRVLAVDRP